LHDFRSSGAHHCRQGAHSTEDTKYLAADIQRSKPREGAMAKNALLMLVLGLAAVSPVIASEAERKSLAGISGMNLTAEILGGDALETQLNKEQLKTEVEDQLRPAEIRVDSEYSPYIYVRINCALPKSSSGQEMGYVAMVQVTFMQDVYIMENSYNMYAPTWESRILIWGAQSSFGSDAIQSVRNLMTEFIDDYLAANEKK
jgi:hypothetical protein